MGYTNAFEFIYNYLNFSRNQRDVCTNSLT